jgi:NAD(P)H-hydrate repair Nnr-like enzyme with NAD(P)H-hydrate dehydratase domain
MRLWPQPEAGDVLTGIITSLLAQSYEPVDAAFWVRTFTD